VPIAPRLFKVDYGQEEAAAVFGCDPKSSRPQSQGSSTDANGNVNGAELVSWKLGPTQIPGAQTWFRWQGSARIIDTQLVLIAALLRGNTQIQPKPFGATMDNMRLMLDTKRRFPDG
jgi:glutamate synthase (NADPH/NADH) small chain